MKKILNLATIIALGFLLLTSACKKDDNIDEITGEYLKGVLVSNEGPFQSGSGTISFYDPKDKIIENNIFSIVNGRPLGNIVQSLEVFNDRVYIVVNNAAKVEVAEAGTFESIAVIEGLTSPRYFVGITNNKGYVSDWGGHVAIIDLNTLTKTGSIATGAAPDRMLLDGTRVWVLNSAGLSSDSTLSIIDSQTDTPLHTIVVGDNPSGIVKDINNKIWVICGGIFDWNNPSNNTPGELLRINPETFAIEKKIEFDDTFFNAQLAINAARNKLYFNFTGGLFTLDVNTPSAQNVAMIINRTYYALGIDPYTDEIYTSDPLDYAQPGYIFRFDASNNMLIDSVKAGIIPGNFLFLN